MYVFALEVFHALRFQGLIRSHVDDLHGYGFQTSEFGGAKTAGTRDDLKPLRLECANQQGFQDTVCLEALREFLQTLSVISPPGIRRGFLQLQQRQVAIS